jgi:hypothetical protein
VVPGLGARIQYWRLLGGASAWTGFGRTDRPQQWKTDRIQLRVYWNAGTNLSPVKLKRILVYVIQVMPVPLIRIAEGGTLTQGQSQALRAARLTYTIKPLKSPNSPVVDHATFWSSDEVPRS